MNYFIYFCSIYIRLRSFKFKVRKNISAAWGTHGVIAGRSGALTEVRGKETVGGFLHEQLKVLILSLFSTQHMARLPSDDMILSSSLSISAWM